MTETVVKITLGHSPDSDDAFMFYALARHQIDEEGYEFEHTLMDIETLNQWALQAKLHVTAISVHGYPYVSDNYAILPHGASMGDNYGPIVVAMQDGAREVKGRKIAIPGTLTTAYLALQLYEKDFTHVVVPFDEIEQFVLDGKADAGLLIHEGQLTYSENGLRKIVDLGEWWSARTGGLPLPLGGNIIRRDLGPAMIAKVSKLLHDSISYALSNREAAVEYAIQFGRGLDRARTDRFVGMYVNDLTLSYGERGRRGVERLMAEAFERGLIPQPVPVEFAGPTSPVSGR
jgi:1,4-dihydroxy-6-naphthoate synthase